MGSQCLGCFIDDVLKETQRQLAASEEARKKAEANCELYAAEMSEAKAAGWFSAQELFDAYKKLVAELAKLWEQEPIAVVEEVGKMPDGTTVFNSSGNVQVGNQLYAAPVAPADVVELEARSEQWARLYNSADNDANEYAHKNTLLQAQIAMKDEALNAMDAFMSVGELVSLRDKALSATSESVAAWEEAKLKPLQEAARFWQDKCGGISEENVSLQQQVAILRKALKPSYIFYMIEVERVGWLSGKKDGQLSFTHTVEDAITFFDRHSAEIILREFFGSEVSYMHPTTYGRVSVTDHVFCNFPDVDTQATAEAYEREVKVKALKEARVRIRQGGTSVFSEILDEMIAELRAKNGG